MTDAHSIALEHVCYAIGRGQSPDSIARSVGSNLRGFTCDQVVELIAIKWRGLHMARLVARAA